MPHNELARRPRISVIIPVYNGASYLEGCIQSVLASDFPSFEIIIVDDHSTDATPEIARRLPCTFLQSTLRVGPAEARNIGSREARGDIFFFLDSDILVERETLRAIVAAFDSDPGLSALFGSYRQKTIPRNFFSRYKNLVHHFTHQQSREDASTFCGGFGAIRRRVFLSLGGFDPDFRFLEDIELGYRMSRRGMRVRLCKQIQFTHCKHYSLASLVRSDVFGRAVPWTRLMLDRAVFRNDLNTRWNNIASVPVAFLLPFAPLLPARAGCALLLLALFVALNARFLSLAYSDGGKRFAFYSCLMCWFSYIYSGTGAILGVAAHLQERARAAMRSTVDPLQS